MDGLNNKTNNIGMKKKEEKEEKTMKGLKDKTNNIEMKKKLYELNIKKRLDKIEGKSGTIRISINQEALNDQSDKEDYYMEHTRAAYLNTGFTEIEHNVFKGEEIEDKMLFVSPFISMVTDYSTKGIWSLVEECVLNIGDFEEDIFWDIKCFFRYYTDGKYFYLRDLWGTSLVVREKITEYPFPCTMEYYKGNGVWLEFDTQNSSIVNVLEDDLIMIYSEKELDEALKKIDDRVF